MDGVPLSLPALTQAQEYQDRAARVGFDWPEIEGVLDKVREEIAEYPTFEIEKDDAGEIRMRMRAAEADRIRERIGSGIAANGELPEENKRTNNGMWYTFFAMTSMTTAVQIILNTTGDDLYGYTAPNGRSIRLALDKEFFYAVHPEEWPYPLPEGLAGELWRILYPCDDTIQLPYPNGWPGTLFEVMSDVYGVAEWEDWVSPHRPQRGYHAWIYVTLVRQTP